MKFSDLFSKPSDATEHVQAGFNKETGRKLIRLLRDKGLSQSDIDNTISIVTNLQVDSFVAGGQFALDRLETMSKGAH